MLQIRWHGHSCFEITNDVTIVTDPHDGRSIGIPAPSVIADIILVSHNHYDHNSVKTVEKTESKVVTDGRKRNIDNIEIYGIDAFHDEENETIIERAKNIIRNNSGYSEACLLMFHNISGCNQIKRI